jgi:hypothetical protein
MMTCSDKIKELEDIVFVQRLVMTMLEKKLAKAQHDARRYKARLEKKA